MHLAKPPGEYRRGKRTRAKEKLYKIILREIRLVKPELENFNIGRTTRYVNMSDRWTAPYMHWNFVPKKHKFNNKKTKP